MKLRINFDLIKKINQSENGYIIDRATLLGDVCALPMAYNLVTNELPQEIGIPLLIISYPISIVIANKVVSKIFSTNFLNVNKLDKERADIYLEDLVDDLLDININTNLELLKEAEVIETDYKYVDSKPILKRERYIEIPLLNGSYETLLEEHNVGGFKYDLSIGEPTKKLKLKPVKSM